MFSRNRHFLITDIVLLALAVYWSYVLRLETFNPSSRWWPGMWVLLVLIVCVTPMAFRWAGIYSRFWRYASVEELLLLTLTWSAVVSGVAIAGFVLDLVTPMDLAIPRSIPMILLLLGLVATAGPRLLLRILLRHKMRRAVQREKIRAVAVMGAGDAGAMIARELQQNPQLGMRAVAFFDDDPAKHNMVICGVRVLGGRTGIPAAVAELGIAEVIIAMPTAPGKEIREVVRLCQNAGVHARILPGVFELLDGKVTVNQLRNVQIEDLLRRAVVETDTAAVRRLLAGKRVLITGGGGSIGLELARQAGACAPAALFLLGHGENSIFEAVQELTARRISPTPVGIVADIRFPDRLRQVFAEVRPEIVFHAAAHKHVPLMELYPAEAVANNVIGTRNLLEAAVSVGVEHFVMISTDKAVNPTNIMGVSKRVAELLVHQTAQRTGLPYVAVRFGNVLGSRGSVLHTFRRQIAAGGPVTITHPDMKRYFMTIPEAVQLVLQASVLGRGGEVFVLDMGEPVRILDLATDLIRLSGLEIGRDIDLAITEPRPGEKLFEELFVEGEDYHRTEHRQIFIAANASSFVPRDLDRVIDALQRAAEANNRVAMTELFRRLVPEYEPLTPVAASGQEPAPDHAVMVEEPALPSARAQ
ncbi:MAG TPA: nucleoside-diphosphate sugar epimerase/dehydratase [Caldilineaceae bacterium]|nr:nucleoside-diphosphate sugar epimerase/dehydratase [Caldilineaceae bacterium]